MNHSYVFFCKPEDELKYISLKGVENFRFMELIQVFFSTSFDIPTEAATGGILKKVFQKLSQYSLENTCVGVSF